MLPDAEELRAEGNAAFREERWADAERAYTAALEAVAAAGAPPDKKLLSNRSAANFRLAKAAGADDAAIVRALDAAVADGSAAVEVDPTWPKGWCRIGAALIESARYVEAVEVLEKGVVVCDMPDVRAQLESARALVREHDAPSVKARMRADALAEAGDLKPALAAYNVAVKHCKDEARFVDKRIYSGRCMVLMRMADEEEEMAETRAAAAGGGGGTSGGGDAGDGDEAASAASAGAPLSRMRRKESMASADSGEAGGKAGGGGGGGGGGGAGLRDRALEDAERCVRTDPTDPIAWLCKAHALTGLERYADARRELRRALELCQPSSARAGDEEAAAGERRGCQALRDIDRKQGIQRLTELLSEVTGVLDGQDHAESSRSKMRDSAARSARGGKVKDTSLYDTLGVAPDATDSAIKKAYYLQAKRCHPDRHPDDPEATEKFQKLGEAYQILSNEQQRSLYDLNGLDGIAEGNFESMDSSQLFDMMFGSDQFEFLIGELQLASLASNVDEEGNPPSADVLERIQATRVRKLVDELLLILVPWLDGDKDAFMQWANTKASCLSEANNGYAMLYVIGQVYSRKADISLGKNHLLGIPSMMSSFGYSTHKLSTQIKASGAAIKVMDKQRRMQEQVEKMAAEGKEVDEEEATRMAMDMVENAFDMMWKITIVDIQTTLDEVANFILSGKDLPDEKEVKVDAVPASEPGRTPSFAQVDGRTSSFSASVAGTDGLGRAPSMGGASSSAPNGHAERKPGVSVTSVGSTIRSGLMNPGALVSKLSLDTVEKSLERFLLPKKEHREGKAVRTRDDVLHARATGLKRLGRVFMQIGQGSLASAGGAAAAKADTGENADAGSASEGAGADSWFQSEDPPPPPRPPPAAAQSRS